jgi:hypothetical protein
MWRVGFRDHVGGKGLGYNKVEGFREQHGGRV